ncbi:MAG TPA: cell wall hydrolase [Allosphingosinicella sp.]|nr:cell wall hydrolase [Allosphingosinicella sp.]
MRIRIGLAFLAAACIAMPARAQTALTAANLGIEGLADPAPAPAATTSEVEVVGRPLSELVAIHAAGATADDETECLARAVYWESRGEPLSGQLAVAEVVINRARSGRFAPTLCGVVRQPYQFSFVRRGYIPQPPQGSRDWQTAVAIARIATDRLAEGGAPDALFFHARRINPGWRRLTRIATVGNHVFYR